MLELPIVDADDVLAYGVWSSLSKRSFDRVVEFWDEPQREDEPPYFGWLSNSIKPYPDTLNLRLNVVTRELPLRPAFVLEETDHPLAVEQREGITMERVRELAELFMHQ